MPNFEKVTAIVMLGVAMVASWELSVDPAWQETFKGLFIASVAWTPVTNGLRAVARAFMKG